MEVEMESVEVAELRESFQRLTLEEQPPARTVVPQLYDVPKAPSPAPLRAPSMSGTDLARWLEFLLCQFLLCRLRRVCRLSTPGMWRILWRLGPW